MTYDLDDPHAFKRHRLSKHAAPGAFRAANNGSTRLQSWKLDKATSTLERPAVRKEFADEAQAVSEEGP